VSGRYALKARGPDHPDRHYRTVDQALGTMWGKEGAMAIIQHWREDASARSAEREKRSVACEYERTWRGTDLVADYSWHPSSISSEG
jgi:hypothetical protein